MTASAPVTDSPPMADTPMWLSHHWPDAYDRCAVVGGKHVCRRCLALYPLALVAGVAISIGTWWPHGIDAWAMWLLPLPGVIEFALDNLRLVGYSPRRQVLLTLPGAVAAGLGYTLYLEDTFDPLVLAVAGVYGTVCLVVALVGAKVRRQP